MRKESFWGRDNSSAKHVGGHRIPPQRSSQALSFLFARGSSLRTNLRMRTFGRMDYSKGRFNASHLQPACIDP